MDTLSTKGDNDSKEKAASYSLFDRVLNWIMHIQWFIISKLLIGILIRAVYAPDHIWIFFSITTIAIGFILYYFWPRMCLCDEVSSKSAGTTIEEKPESNTSTTEKASKGSKSANKRKRSKSAKRRSRSKSAGKRGGRSKSRRRSRSKKKTNKLAAPKEEPKVVIKEEPEIDSKATFDYDFQKPEKKPRRSRSNSRSKSR